MFLFEILIGLSLLSILLWVLFSFLRSSSAIDQKMEKMTHSLLERKSLIQRLHLVFSSMVIAQPGKSTVFFYTQQFDEKKPARLVIHFDHGIDPDPAFSGPCVGAVFLNEKKELQLSIWPIDRDKDKTNVREEILLTHVDTFSFRWPKKGKDGPISWEKERSKKEGGSLPSFICLDVWMNSEKEPISFPFLILSKDPVILYSSGEKKI